MFQLSKKVVISEFLSKIFILNAVYRDEAHGGMNISSACIFQSCEKIFNNGVFVNLYAEKALHQQHYNIFDSCLQNKVNYK